MPPFLSPRITTPQHSTHAPQAPSPNYFGFQSSDADFFLTDSATHHAKQNWSRPSSAVRSTAAGSPTLLPVDRNPDFDAFKKQTDVKTFDLGNLGENKVKPPPALPATSTTTTATSKAFEKKTKVRTTPPKDAPPSGSIPRSTSPTHLPPPPPPSQTLRSKTSLDPGLLDISQSPKRMLSPGSLTYPEPIRRPLPADSEPVNHSEQDSSKRNRRVKLPLDQQSFAGYAIPKRAETLPERGSDEVDGQYMTTSQHLVNLLDSSGEMVLLLDLRVSTLYAQSHISGALNLCIPTTLLKRPSFNVQKLAETFSDHEQRARFEKWRNSKYIVVYDNASSQLKDAAICINTIKKFQSEGYTGTTYIVKGGFLDLSRRFPALVGVARLAASSDTTQGPSVAPVIGGCPMPETENPANPFFGNIRQNMDLIGGVGQIALKHPPRATKAIEEHQYPDWLKQASAEHDHGQTVSKRFELIERREKKRMEDALCGKVSWGSASKAGPAEPKSVQIAGIEKGGKNRYNNVWPFEHSRVKLQGVPHSGCDYFNANFVQAAWSNKRYISTQAPIPATVNDFWNVIWQQDVRVIVMLTAEKEGVQVKAHNYWDQKQFGSLNLDFLSEKRASLDTEKIARRSKRPSTGRKGSSFSPASIGLGDDLSPNGESQPYVVVRKFTLSHATLPFERMREITQLQYSSWPDFGAPADPAHLLGLVEQTDAVVRSIDRAPQSAQPASPHRRPVLVHCSAGCGRTGTFCTVDSVIDMLKRQRASKAESRGPSPMDVDGGSPIAKDGDRKSSGGDPQGVSDDEVDSGIDTDTDTRLEGSWIGRQDLDLVEKTVEDFRNQRLSMVQNLRQYVLCYESVMEWIVAQELERDAV